MDGSNMVGLTTEEAREQMAGVQIAGCGCLIFLAVLLGAALLATCVIIDKAFDREVAAYSLCERCGAVLHAGNVHAACMAEGEAEVADAR